MRILRYLLLSLLLASVACGQPVVVDVKTNSVGANPLGSSLTISSVAVSGSNRGLYLCLGDTGSVGEVSTVLFNGSEAFSLVYSEGTTFQTAQVWYLPNPTSTTANVVITLSPSETESGTLLGTVIALSNAKQEVPTNHEEASGGCSCSSKSVNLTTVADNSLMLTCIVSGHGSQTWNHGAGQTERSDFAQAGGSGDNTSTSTEVQPSAGLETLTSTLDSSSTSTTMEMVAIEVEEFVAAESTRRRLTPWVLR